MKKKELKEIQVCVKMETSKVDEIDRLAEKMRLNRAQLVRNLIDTGLDDLRIMNKSGILSLAVKGIDIFEVIKKALNEKRYIIDGNDKLIIDL